MEKREIGKTLMIAQNHVVRLFEKMKNDTILPRSQGRILRFIYNNKERDIYQKDIENEFNLRRSSATEILQKLESIHMIKRMSDGNDKRIKKIQITKEGEKIAQDMIYNIQKVEKILHQDILQEDLEIFFKVIDRMIENCIKEKEEEK
ncbi:MAG: MarR family transcriptional regulator [Bacilli bacterium]|nr:MarR family transcriptional regulator [Bacilli bacterium]